MARPTPVPAPTPSALRYALCLLLVSSAPAVAAAQARDPGARLERVADSVYVIIHDDATDEWPHGNTGVVVTSDGVLVVDATYLPSRARQDIALIRTVSTLPVRYLAYTHWHFDHNNGGVAYRDSFPGVTIVSERHTAEWIVLNSTYWSRLSTAAGSARRASLAALERELAAGADSAGRAFTADEKRRRATAVAQRKAELDELGSLNVVAPDLVFDGELTLTLGGRRIELRDRGAANSPHDVTIYLPRDSVLFTGDIVVQSPLPYVSGAAPLPWIEVLRGLEKVPMTAVVPGHGPVMRTWEYPRQVRALMEAATARAADGARRGRSLAQLQDSVSLDDVRRATPVWGGAALDADWKATVRILLELAWRGVRGYN